MTQWTAWSSATAVPGASLGGTGTPDRLELGAHTSIHGLFAFGHSWTDPSWPLSLPIYKMGLMVAPAAQRGPKG